MQNGSLTNCKLIIKLTSLRERKQRMLFIEPPSKSPISENAKGRIPLPNRMKFWKKSKRSLTPPSSFWKIMLHFFYIGYGCIYARRHRPDSISWYQLISIQLLKKTYPEPWNYSSFYQFHSQFHIQKFILQILGPLVYFTFTLVFEHEIDKKKNNFRVQGMFFQQL